MKRVYLAQVNNRFGENIHFPYSVGLLWGYFLLSPRAKDYELAGFLYHKDPIDEVVAKLEAPDVLALSTYIWNEKYNQALANAVHKRWPECLVVAGGPQIPDEPKAKDFGHFDLLIHGEGEGPFRKLLEDDLDPTWVPGLSYVFHPDLDTVVTNPKGALIDPNEIPSPYLSGIFDSLVPQEKSWVVPSETHRGCPYACNFCVWGSESMSKIRQFDTERVVAEFEWAAKAKASLAENTDANFGMFARDVDMVKEMVRIKRAYGYPQRFRAAFAKNTGDRVFEISQLLTEAGMHKATTIALQSLDEQTLISIKRKNIKFDGLPNLLTRYRSAGVATYSEIILGLPTESLDTFKRGVGALFDAGQHDSTFIYNLVALNNTPYVDPAYIEEHDLKIVPMQAMLLHATPDDRIPVEIQNTVVGTKDMPHEDWLEGWMFSWLTMLGHGLGLTQWLAREMRSRVTYEKFYTDLLHHMRDTNVVKSTLRVLKEAVHGGSWNMIDKRYGDITWPPDEFAFLDIMQDLDGFYDQLEGFAPKHLLDVQRSLIVRPEGDFRDYAKQNVWYQRKGVNKRVREHFRA